MNKKLQIGIIGSAGADDYLGTEGATKKMLKQAYLLGKLLAKNNCIIVTGGKSGIMKEAARGAKIAGGITVGVVKGKKRYMANEFIDVEVISGMEVDGLDELLIINMCDALIAIGGGAGTLQEIVIAYRNSKPVVAMMDTGGWSQILAGKYLDERKRINIYKAFSEEEAVQKVMELIKIK